MNITNATAQGNRPYQEDRFVVSDQAGGKLVAVMDGHGGAEVADRIAKALPALWRKHVVDIKPDGVGYMSVALYGTMVEVIGEVFGDIHALTSGMDAGSTISIVFIPDAKNEILVAILGDSPVIVFDTDGRVDVGPVHNARSNASELLAAQQRGAFFDGNYIYSKYSGHGIQMTRVMGDRDLTGIINREPEIYSRVVGPNSFVLIGSDGLFDPSHRDMQPQVEDIVAQILGGADAQALVDRALAVPTNDNVTAVLVRLGNKKQRKKKTEAVLDKAQAA